MTRSLPRAVRVGIHIVLVVGIAAAVMATTVIAGVTTTMRQSHGLTELTPPTTGWPTPPAPQAGRITVAVVLGTSGSVVTDVLAPYEVFARSSAFQVYTVAERRQPVALTGGLPVLPHHTFDTVTADPALRPDVVVVPALAEPAGDAELPLREWVAQQARRGTRILGVCSGAHVLAAAGILNGRTATSFWFRVGALQKAYPDATWVTGERYVQDGPITTTAGVTSGVIGALRLVEQLAGPAEAERIGSEVSYPGWSMSGTTAIGRHRLAIGDLPYALNAAFPWGRPTIGVGLVDEVGETEVAAAFELYSATSSAARTVPLAGRRWVTTRHGVVLIPQLADGDSPAIDRLVVPGVEHADDVGRPLTRWAAERHLTVELPHQGRHGHESGIDPVLRDLASRADVATARTAAKFTEYPVDHLQLDGPDWPWRPTVLFVVALALSVATGIVAVTVVPRIVRRLRGSGRGAASVAADGRSRHVGAGGDRPG
ncbi:protein DJ-1 [Jiangella ureilytica]|uniref:Protein DJ-1 n=1 Tax=Jiangella ureilytica TaxID=2530374 RepID=A0A4R4REM9_9ACTN|nr:DJ-1/PfpI family protein [Jiangella ureilytica]TDC47717.1 protein DJ-1 [Jiangella ureilytica]